MFFVRNPARIYGAKRESEADRVITKTKSQGVSEPICYRCGETLGMPNPLMRV